jgi:rfaE bifunctional protein kinase chain/domain
VIVFDEKRLKELFSGFAGKKIAVVGDVMIDRYYWGTVTRISPEAPVPVVDVVSESVRLGGAANVAHNIQVLGGDPIIVGLIGNDYAGQLFQNLMQEMNLNPAGIVVDDSRSTTLKTRVIAHDQHVVRIDNESKTECPERLLHRVIDAVKYNIHDLDAVILEDYNKGVITRDVIRELVSVANKYQKIITVDPKFNNFFEYSGVTVFKPNRKEVEEVMGGRLLSEKDVNHAGKELLKRLGVQNVLLTRGEEGMSLFEATGGVTHIPSSARVVRDVSGAGDTVISTLTLSLAGGATVQEASMLANCAGGVVVGAVGIVPIQPGQLLEAALAFSSNGR